MAFALGVSDRGLLASGVGLSVDIGTGGGYVESGAGLHPLVYSTADVARLGEDLYERICVRASRPPMRGSSWCSTSCPGGMPSRRMTPRPPCACWKRYPQR